MPHKKTDKTAPRPDVLLICTDHWPGHLLRCAGHPIVQTPTLDNLATLGTRFTCAYSASPVCVPARRSLMTGLSMRSHAGGVMDARMPMPAGRPLLAECFRDAGYQTLAVGKLHVHPRRNRIGFDKVIFNEEGRSTNGGGRDDWEKDLDARGFGGQAYATGGCNNDYLITPWHLPWDLHPTNWTARRACSLIRDLDPGRPAFLYVSFTAPHPPLWTMPAWTELYDGADIDAPVRGDWTRNPPFRVRAIAGKAASMRQATAREIAAVRRAFYSQLTHLDRQIRFILGTLREQGRLEHTIIAFTSDHGDMLGDHGMWSKGLMYEGSARVPLLIAPPAARSGQARGATDPRIAELRDIMPTLLSMAGLPVPARLDGIDLFSGERRDYLFGELGQGAGATRMVRDERHKLVYYAEGNRRQLFDLQEDPRELRDLAESKSHRGVLRRMTRQLAGELYGESLGWLDGDRLRGLPACTDEPPLNWNFSGQRGLGAG